MNISHEFSKIRDSFRKVKTDMDFLSEKISENYDEFTRRHKVLGKDIENLTLELKTSITKLRETFLDSSNNNTNNLDLTQINSLKLDIKELKSEIISIQKSHHKTITSIDDVKKNKKDIKSLKEKLHSSELEIFLLKERLTEKDLEVKQIKEISKHLFNVVEDLSKSELELINYSHKKIKNKK